MINSERRAEQNARIGVRSLHAAGSEDEEAKAREGLFLLSNALEIARRHLRTVRLQLGIE